VSAGLFVGSSAVQELDELRDRVCQANLELVLQGLVIRTWGNVSGIHRESGLVAIKPSGVRYDELTPAMIPLVDLEGAVVEGGLRPSSDLPTHLELYKAFAAVGGIAHTHSRCATAFAQACRELPCLGTTHADHFFGPVPVTRKLRAEETAADYEADTGGLIVETIAERAPLQTPAVLVAQHGPFTWGRTPGDAVTNSVVLEAVAGMALHTLQLAPDAEPLAAHLLQRHFLRKHGPNAYYGQNPVTGSR